MFTKEDAQWALRFANRSKDKVKIFAPTIAAQSVLRKANSPPFEYFSKKFYFPKNYAERTTILAKQTYHVTKHFSKHFPHPLEVFGVSLKTILTLRFEYAFFAVIAAYTFYKQIDRTLHPKEYWVPSHLLSKHPLLGHRGENLTATQLIVSHFAPAKKVRYYGDENPHSPIRSLHCVVPVFTPISLLIKIFVFGQRIVSDMLRLVFPLHPSPKDILFYSFGYNLDYYSELLRLTKIHRVLNRMHIICGVQPLEAEWLLIRHQIPFTPMRYFIDSSLKKRIAAESQRIRQYTSSLTKEGFVDAFPKTTPLPLKNALADKAHSIIQSLTHQYILPTAVAAESIKKLRPKLVITTHDPTPSAIPFVFIAQRQNISTLLLLHGVIDKTLMNAWYKSEHIQLWGNWMVKHFPSSRSQLSTRKLYSTGFPHLDSIFREQEKMPDPSYEYLSSKRPLIFTIFLSQYLPDTSIMSKFLNDLFFALKKESLPIQIIARVHREQSSEGFQELANEHGINFALDNDSSLEKLTRNADLILAMDTTAILWPMIFKKPLLYTTPWWGSGTLPIKEFNAAPIPRDAQQLMVMIKELFRQPSRVRKYQEGQREFLKNYVGMTKGDASKKTLELIQRLCP